MANNEQEKSVGTRRRSFFKVLALAAGAYAVKEVANRLGSGVESEQLFGRSILDAICDRRHYVNANGVIDGKLIETGVDGDGMPSMTYQLPPKDILGYPEKLVIGGMNALPVDGSLVKYVRRVVPNPNYDRSNPKDKLTLVRFFPVDEGNLDTSDIT